MRRIILFCLILCLIVSYFFLITDKVAQFFKFISQLY